MTALDSACRSSSNDLSSLLWQSTALRERRHDGRFGIPWENRPAPSAGGLHAIRIIVMPLEDDGSAGEYYRISADEPAWLGAQLEELGRALHTVRSERLAALCAAQDGFGVTRGGRTGCLWSAELSFWLVIHNPERGGYVPNPVVLQILDFD